MKKIALFLAMAVAALACTPEETVTPELKVLTEASELVAPQAESQVYIDFETNVAWTATIEANDWSVLSPNPATGEAGTHKLTVTCLANGTNDSRTVKVTITAQDKVEEVVITQAQKDALTVGEKTFTVPADGGNIEFTVAHNVEFTATTEADWLTRVETKAMEETKVVFKAAENTGAERTATIVVAGAEFSETLTVTQDAWVPQFEVSASELWFSIEGATSTLEVIANIEYELTVADNDWLTMTQDGNIYTFTASAYDGFDQRSVAVYVTPIDEAYADYARTVYAFQNGRINLAWTKVPTVDYADYAAGPVRLAKYGEYVLLANLNKVFAINPADGTVASTYVLPEGYVCNSLCVDDGGNIIIANEPAFSWSGSDYCEILDIYYLESLDSTPQHLVKYSTGNIWGHTTGNLRVKGNIKEKALIVATASGASYWLAFVAENGTVAQGEWGWSVWTANTTPYTFNSANNAFVVPVGNTLADGLWFAGYNMADGITNNLQFCADPSTNAWTKVGETIAGDYNPSAFDIATVGTQNYAALLAGAHFTWADPCLLLYDVTDVNAPVQFYVKDLGAFAQRNDDWSLVNWTGAGAYGDVLVDVTETEVAVYFVDANFNMIGKFTIQ